MKKIFTIILLTIFGLSKQQAIAQPNITAFAPTSGLIGTTVVISGSNFNITPANNIVFFGATKATVSSGSSTTLTVTVPLGASYQPISVTNITTGLTAYSAQPFNVTFPAPCSAGINLGTFAAKADFITGTKPYSVCIGDFDGDGKTDIAVANYLSTSISVYRNTSTSGTISFAAKVDFATGSGPQSVSTGDFDGDGKKDIVVTNEGGSVSVLRNTGNFGTISFAAKVDFITGTNPYCVTVGDFNVDGKTDLAVANRTSNTVSVFKNTCTIGIISFAAKVDFTTGTNPRSVAVGDLDGDGKTDLTVANASSATVSIFKNTGSGGIIAFAPKVDFVTGTIPYGISIGDLDGDGKKDLAIANYGPATVSILRNIGSTGTISFAPKVDYITGSQPYGISMGDLDGDGKTDLALANGSGNTVSILRNTGSTGTISFDPKVDFLTGSTPFSVAIGDFDGDGKSDLVLSNYNSNTISVLRNLNARCLPTFTSFSPASGPIGTTVIITGTNFSTTLANNIVFFGATMATITAGSATSLTVTVPAGASYQPISVTNLTLGLSVYSAQPFLVTFSCGGIINATSFAPKVDYIPGSHPRGLTIGDLDGDGKTDLAVANYTANTVSVFRNLGSAGTISFAPKVDFAVGTQPNGLIIGDLDGDGKLDLAVTNAVSNSTSVLRNTSSIGIISFAPKIDFTTFNNPLSIAIGDFDGDGKSDLAHLSFSSVYILRNTGNIGAISFAPLNVSLFSSSANCLISSDIDGDGKTDLAVTNGSSNSVSVLRNTGNIGIISFAAKVDFTTGTSPKSVSVGDFDGDGKTDLAVANDQSSTVSVFRNTGNAGTISFATKIDFTTGTSPQSVSVGDFDGDGKTDLAVPNGSGLSMFRNTGSSGIISFAPKVDFTIVAWNVAPGDFDGDGKLDFAVTVNNSGSGAVSVFRNTTYLGPIVTANTTSTTICAGANITLTGSGATSYSWSSGVIDGVAFIPPTGNTTYTVTGINAATACSNNATISITVNSLPTLNISSTNTLICVGETATITANSSASTYSWSNGSSSSSIIVTPSVTTIYTITVSNGLCNSNSSYTQSVSVCTSLNELKNNSIKIYPNPASAELTISSPIKFTDVKIVNSIGQIVQESKYNNTVSIAELSSGIYFLQLFNENGNLLKIAKFIKE
jgi:hypothetical protein